MTSLPLACPGDAPTSSGATSLAASPPLVPVSAIVLSDGQPDALDTALDARRFAHTVRIVERDPARLAALRSELAGGPDVEVVGAEWRGDEDPVALSGATSGWLVVLAAGERLAPADPVALHRRLGQPGLGATSQTIQLVGTGDQDRVLAVHGPRKSERPPLKPARPGPCEREPCEREPCELEPCEPLEPSSCPVCGSGSGFEPLPRCFVDSPAAAGFSHPVGGWELLGLDCYSCRSCGASDRDRMIWLYLETLALPAAAAVVEIAPSPALSPRLRRRFGAGYRSADLLMAGVDDRIDLCAMSYPDASFDLLICSHVLEHVDDDVAAMAEIGRVLRPGGVGVLLVPISTVNDRIIEDPSITEPADRLRSFGQEDHVRVYTRRGFVERLSRAGLSVDVVGVDALDPGAGRCHALPATAALYVVQP